MSKSQIAPRRPPHGDSPTEFRKLSFFFVAVNSTSYARAKNFVQGFPEATRQANKNGESSNS